MLKRNQTCALEIALVPPIILVTIILGVLQNATVIILRAILSYISILTKDKYFRNV